MTGAYFFAVRDGERNPVEVEFLTPEERKEKLGEKSPEFLLSVIELCCKELQEIDAVIRNEPIHQKGLWERKRKELEGR